jgi:hypothetical protein
MKEYKIIGTLNWNNSQLPHYENQFNSLAHQGWKMIHVVSNGTFGTPDFVFEREIPK